MDDLQDAIEDANYVSAMVYAENKGPRPVVMWKIPSESQLEEWKLHKCEQVAKELEITAPVQERQQPRSFSEMLLSPFVSHSNPILGQEEEGEKRQTQEEGKVDGQPPMVCADDVPCSSLPSTTPKLEQSENITTTDSTTILADSTTTRTTITNSAASGACWLGEDTASKLQEITVGQSPLQDYEYICSQPLGFFLFAHYVKDVRKDYVRMNFVEDVAKYKMKVGQQRQLQLSLSSAVLQDMAREIANSYLIHRHAILQQKHTIATVPVAVASVHSEADSIVNVDRDRNVLVLKSPSDRQLRKLPKKDIVELDLHRPIYTTINNKRLLSNLSDDVIRDKQQKILLMIEKLLKDNLDNTCTDCPIGIRNGEILSQTLLRCGFPTQTDFAAVPGSLPISTTKATSTNSSQTASNTNNMTDADEITTAITNKKYSYFDDIGNIFDLLEFIVLEGLVLEYWQDFITKSVEYKRLLNFWWFRDCPVVEEDFYLIRVLGRGGFGLVHACKKGASGKLFAMKIMNKKRMKRKKSEQLALNELNALKAVDSPFVVRLFYAFQSIENLFLILDLMMGGNLAYHLQVKGQFSKRECIYFSGRILLGLQALHDCNYVYRDLKPENVLVAYDGRVKLSDLGLATPLTPTLHGPAGTRGYWAPEMLQKDASGQRQTYDQTVDWFSFGCCIYEFISGYNPFRSQDALQFGLKAGMETKEKALDYATLKMHPSYDSSLFDKSAEDLCRKLLDKDNRKRLGKNGCQEIKDHPYYWRLNWESILSDRMSPPFIPEKDVNALPQSDIGTFSPGDGDNEINLEPSDDAIYKEWNWTNQSAFDGEVIEFLIHERRIGKPLLPDEPSSCSSCCTCL